MPKTAVRAPAASGLVRRKCRGFVERYGLAFRRCLSNDPTQACIIALVVGENGGPPIEAQYPLLCTIIDVSESYRVGTAVADGVCLIWSAPIIAIGLGR